MVAVISRTPEDAMKGNINNILLYGGKFSIEIN